MGRSVQYASLVLEILHYFCVDLGASKEEMNCVNGRRKRVKSFTPHALPITQTYVHLLQQTSGSVGNDYISKELFSSFIRFVVSLYDCVSLPYSRNSQIPEEVIITVIPIVNEVVIPYMNSPDNISTCLAYLSSLVK